MHSRSRHRRFRLIALLIAPLLGVGLAGCGKQGAGSDAAGVASSGGAAAGSSGSGGTGGTGITGGSSASGAGTAGTGDSRAGAVIEDTLITTKLKAALLADTTLKGASISVETRNGEVVLTGSVNSQAQREHAAQIAQALNGVKNVNNKLAMKQ